MVKIKEIDSDSDNEIAEVEQVKQEQLLTSSILRENEEFKQFTYSNIFRQLNKGMMDECIEMIEQDHSLVFSTEDHYGMTILHIASQNKMRRLVKRILDIVSEDDLLSNRFDINKVDLNNNTALHYACTSSISEITPAAQQQQQQFGQIPIIDTTSTSTTDNQQSDINSFMYLKEKKSTRYEIVKLLLERGASSSILNKLNLLPIHLACKEIDFKIVELLIDNGDGSSTQIYEPHSKVLDSLNFSLIFQSLQSENNKFLTNREKERNELKKEVILSKIDPNLKCIKNGPTCLHFALSNLKRIKELTGNLVISTTGTSPSTSPPALHQTSQDLNIVDRIHPLIKLVKLLLQKQCKPNHIDESTGKSAYHQFIDIFPTEDIEFHQFLKFDQQSSDSSSSSSSPITLGQQEQKQNEFKLMISNLIYSVTRLFHQYKYDFTMSSQKSILESDKDIEETPLGQCSMYPCKKIILEQILNYLNSSTSGSGGNSGNEIINASIIDSVNSRGQPALFIACSNGNIEAVDLLLENGANPNIQDKYGSSMLHESINFKHYEIAKKLILCGSDVNQPMSVYPQSTPLHLSASQLNFEMCHFLIEHGSLLNVFDSEKQTPKDLISNYLLEENQHQLNSDQLQSIQELKDFFDFHIQINIVQISSFVVFKGDYKLKIKQFIQSKEKNLSTVDKYMNQIFSGNNDDKYDSIIESSSEIQIPLKEIKTSTRRIKIKSSKDTLFKYVNLYHSTYNHLLHVIQNRFKPSSIETIEQFENNNIKSITLLPNVSISNDQDLEFIRDDDELVIDLI